MSGDEVIRRGTPRWTTALLRIATGYVMIAVGVHRLLLWLEDHAVLTKTFERLRGLEQLGWFDRYLSEAIGRLAEYDAFSYLLMAAPMLLGLSLLLGFLTRLSASLGILLVLHTYFITFHSGNVYQALFCQMQIAVLVVLLLSAAGRTFGIDGVLWRRRVRKRFAHAPKTVDAAGRRAAPDAEPIPLSETRPPEPKRPLRVEETTGFFSTQAKPKPAPPKPTPVAVKPAPKPTPAAVKPAPKPTPPPEPAPAPVRAKPDLEPIPLAGETEEPDQPVEERPEPPAAQPPTNVPNLVLSDDGEILVTDMDEEPPKAKDAPDDGGEATDTGI